MGQALGQGGGRNEEREEREKEKQQKGEEKRKQEEGMEWEKNRRKKKEGRQGVPKFLSGRSTAHCAQLQLQLSLAALGQEALHRAQFLPRLCGS